MSGRDIATQAREIITSDTDWIDLAQQLDVARYSLRDNYTDRHHSTPFRPMFLSNLWARVEQIALTTIPRRLQTQPELAEAFGFTPGKVPSSSTFKPCRLSQRFEQLDRTLEQSAKAIRRQAAETGSPIGCDLTADSTENAGSNPHKRTIDRMLRRNGKTVLEEVEQIIFPAISLPRPENPVYDEEDLLMVETVSTINTNGVNQGGEQVGDLLNPDPDTDDPFFEDGPTGETLLESIKELSVNEIATAINFALEKTYTRAKPKLNDLDNFDTDVMVALDITYAAYWGEEEGLEWLQGAPENKEYRKCFKFATAAIVGQHSHYTVAVLPLGSTKYADNDAYPGGDQSYFIGDITRRLLAIATDYVNVRTVVADREFHAADAVAAINQHNLKYIIPARRDNRLKRKCKRFGQLKRGYADEDRDEALHVEKNYGFYGQIKNSVNNTRVTTNLVILPPSEDDDTHGRDEPQPFITNLPVSDEVALDRRWTVKQIQRYSNRAAIENTYTSIKNCAATTTSKEFAVRWFHFGFACLIYNLWLLVDFLTQVRIGVIETRKQPRIKLSRFLRWVERATSTII